MSCTHLNSPLHRFCSECGDKLLRLLCQCGTANDTDHKHCVGCGFNLRQERQSTLAEKQIHKFKLKEFLVPSESMVASEDTNQSVSQDDIDKLMR